MDVEERFVVATTRGLIDRHGIDAAYVAATRVDERLRRGDVAGAAMWRRIVKVIEADN